MQLQKNDCEQYGFQWIEQETFQDINNNGKYDPPEPLKDRNKNGKWDNAEEFLDDNGNGMYDGSEFFIDHNKNGKWDKGEKFTDKNKNGKWDEGEAFTDRVTGTIKYPKPNSCHQSKPKDSYLLGEDKKCQECYYLKSAIKTKCLYGCETDNSEKDNKCEEETTKATGKEKKEKAKSKNLKDYFKNNKK